MRPVSASKTLGFVAIYAPVISRRHWFCSVIYLAAGPKYLVLVSFEESHTVSSKVAAGRTNAVYTCLAVLSVAVCVEAATLVDETVCDATFPWIFLM